MFVSTLVKFSSFVLRSVTSFNTVLSIWKAWESKSKKEKVWFVILAVITIALNIFVYIEVTDKGEATDALSARCPLICIEIQVIARWSQPQADCEDGGGPICNDIPQLIASWLPQADCEDGGGPICNDILQLIASWLPQADCEDGGGPICNETPQLIVKWGPQADCEDGGGPICNIPEGVVA